MPADAGWGRGNRPVINVSWNDTQQYISWLNRKTGKQYRLPTEAEWEYAARAGTTTAYYWSPDVGSNHANCNRCGSRWDNRETSPVGAFDPNRFGLYDMAGNVLQWTQDCYNDSYIGAPSDGSAWASGDCGRRVLRGGSWDLGPRDVRVAYRFRYGATFAYNLIGFRLARTP